VRSYGSTDLDAALLVLPLLGIDDVESPRVRGTIDAIRHELSAGGPLLYRYPPRRDGLPGTEGAFLPCSFWLVQALAHTGRAPKRWPCSNRCSSTPARSASTPKRWTPRPAPTSATTHRR
jgi:GH15 family glucan-1,4-alpha-glucosidase